MNLEQAQKVIDEGIRPYLGRKDVDLIQELTGLDSFNDLTVALCIRSGLAYNAPPKAVADFSNDMAVAIAMLVRKKMMQ